MKLTVVLLTGILLFSALYSPQVVYPLLIRELNVSATDIALLQTAVFIPLTLSPIFYGVVIDRLSPLKVLRFALFFLAVGEIFLALSANFQMMVFSRFFQGLFIPAAMTSVVSYISTSYEKELIQKYISFYMASTMAGGVAGRAAAGLFSTLLGWRYSFAMLGISIFLLFLLTLRLKDYRLPAVSSLAGLKKMFTNRNYIIPVFIAFFGFTVFSSIMNFYSIRLKELSPDLNEFLIGAAYIGSLFGSVTAYLTTYFSLLLRSYRATIAAAFLCMLAALYLFRTDSVTLTVATLFLFCGAFIIIHTSCSTILNKYSDVSKGAVNGVYFTVYYMGGIIGSYLPGYMYEYKGWDVFLIVLVLSALSGFALNIFNRIEGHTRSG